MSTTVRVDRQGRVVIPLQERERLGLGLGGVLELVPTAEGVLLERRRHAAVSVGDDGLPVVAVEGLETVSNDEVVAALHRQRDQA